MKVVVNLLTVAACLCVAAAALQLAGIVAKFF